MTRERKHKRQRRRRSSYHGQGSGNSHAKDDNKEEANVTPSSAAKKSEFSDALLARLSEIGAEPQFVDTKRLYSTDVRIDQNRLQLSVLSPISQILTDAEKVRARTPDGMPVTAFDLRGQRYDMTCKLYRKESRDKYYRFLGPGWKSFLQAYGLMIAKDARLTRHVTVELWAFRSRALLLPVKDDGGGEEEEPGHPDGALGLVLLLLDEGAQEEGAGEKSCARKSLELVGAVALLLLWTMDDD